MVASGSAEVDALVEELLPLSVEFLGWPWSSVTEADVDVAVAVPFPVAVAFAVPIELENADIVPREFLSSLSNVMVDP